ncbi:PQQ-binding-like beta-propeller repeat protein [Fervidobacterium pennivorans subsp. shakshaketiis]|jgi:outer membrane protein assembly factor BamB|uniref:PQQ enzyme repeat-containing protein n=1 Tax=Fervidobacterium pennivorans (strain DSM 9078 / Ven5) TaxID=771875 RepID=H9UE53_FERPD|nr:PQQ-binding-like beta-propeller repeat protein [Fervidobacterium pennivorans]AFG35796.1 PQQ enzyme repeat-containing protein [Fervidobacterium pennivorans DSM 9078]QIV78629.1 PQQ-binding-like beta-propeller repeat protein [Fervidobacterium pennivorans subsp. keratinolyticus]
MKKEEDIELRKIELRRRKALSAIFNILISYGLVCGSIFSASNSLKGFLLFLALIFLVVSVVKFLFVRAYRIFALIYLFGFLLLAIYSFKVMFPTLMLYYLLMALAHMLYFKKTKKKMFSILSSLSFVFSVVDALLNLLGLHFASFLLLLTHQFLLAYAFSNAWYIDAFYFIPRRKEYIDENILLNREINLPFELKQPARLFKTFGEIYSSPFVDTEETVYIVSADATFYKYAFDGTLVWGIELGSESFSGPFADKNGNLYIVDSGGEVRKYTINGERLWSSKIGKTLTFSAALFDDKVYVMTFDGKLYEVDSNGKKVVLIDLSEPVEITPIVTEDGIYVVTYEGKLYRFSGDGKKIWKFNVGSVMSAPVTNGKGSVYVCGCDGYLYSLNSENGSINWVFKTKEMIKLSPTLDDMGNLYVGSGKEVFCINSKGELTWKVKLDCEISVSPTVLSDGHIYVGCKGGDYFAWRNDGRVKWYWKMMTGVYAKPVMSKSGRLYVACTDGNVYLFE